MSVTSFFQQKEVILFVVANVVLISVMQILVIIKMRNALPKLFTVSMSIICVTIFILSTYTFIHVFLYH